MKSTTLQQGRARRAPAPAASLLLLAFLAASMAVLPGCGTILTGVLAFMIQDVEDVTEYEDPPTGPRISSVAPDTGPVAGGTVVTISGVNFQSGCTVDVDGTAATEVTFVASTLVTCRVPAGAAEGDVDVTLTNPDASAATLGGGFTYRDWAYPAWGFRAPFTVTNGTAADLTGFQIQVSVTYAANMDADFNDLRFTQRDSGVETKLSYWVESATPSASTTVWVSVPIIPASGTADLLLYYGNASALDASDFDGVFTKGADATDMVLHWHLDDGLGPVASDASGNGNDGLLRNVAAPDGWLADDGGAWGATATTFATGSALSLDGFDDGVDAGALTALDGAAALTVEAWVRGARGSLSGSEQVLVSRWETPHVNFIDPSRWEAYDPNVAGVGTDPESFGGAAFDGRYVYFVPFADVDTQTLKSEFLRYDTQAAFDAAASWTAYDPQAQAIGTNPEGYLGAVFDGRYVYFTPNPTFGNPGTEHGEFLRLDTQGTFDSSAAWIAFDPGTAGLDSAGPPSVDPDGYWGGCFDGRYAYFMPSMNAGGPHSQFLRYDTQGSFNSVASWTVFDAAYAGVAASGGFVACAFDGRYVYAFGGFASTPELLRYDTQSSFTDAGAWTKVDVSAYTIDIHAGLVVAGPYLYFMPDNDGDFVRYDTRLPLTDGAAWTAINLETLLAVTNLDSYFGGYCDGRYLYCMPQDSDTLFLRYDTTRPVDMASSWTVFNPPGAGVGTPGNMVLGCAFDGRYLYTAPFMQDLPGPDQPGTEALRLDTQGGSASAFSLAYAAADQAGGYGGAPFGVCARLQTDTGFYGAAANATLTGGAWHHVAMTFDGANLVLYVDGSQAATTAATGTLPASTLPLMVGSLTGGGGHLDGAVDEVRVWTRALGVDEIQAHFQRRQYAATAPTVSPLGTEESK